VLWRNQAMSLPYLTVQHPRLSCQQNANHMYIMWHVNIDIFVHKPLNTSILQTWKSAAIRVDMAHRLNIFFCNHMYLLLFIECTQNICHSNTDNKWQHTKIRGCNKCYHTCIKLNMGQLKIMT
jgi:hypothetical protein